MNYRKLSNSAPSNSTPPPSTMIETIKPPGYTVIDNHLFQEYNNERTVHNRSSSIYRQWTRQRTCNDDINCIGEYVDLIYVSYNNRSRIEEEESEQQQPPTKDDRVETNEQHRVLIANTRMMTDSKTFESSIGSLLSYGGCSSAVDSESNQLMLLPRSISEQFEQIEREEQLMRDRRQQ